MHDIETEIEKEPSIGLDAAALDESLANAKSRFGRTDLSVTPPIAPALSEHARELQQLRSQLNDAERMALRAQKAAGEYREQLTEAQADIANMKSRWYAAEKARNAVSSQREVDSSGLNTQVVRLQKELERSQQLASSDMERAATRIRSLEEKLEKALRHASVAEDSQKKSRKRSNVSLALGIAVASIFTGIFVYEKLPRSKSEVTAPTETTWGCFCKPAGDADSEISARSAGDATGGSLNEAFRSQACEQEPSRGVGQAGKGISESTRAGSASGDTASKQGSIHPRPAGVSIRMGERRAFDGF